MTEVLFVVTGADHWTLADGTQHPTGFWAEELIEPYRVFTDAGFRLTFATPGGRSPVVDEASLAPDAAGGEDRSDELRRTLTELKPVLDSPAVLEDVRAEDYDLVFVPGGHGPMEDLAVSEPFGRLLAEFMAAGKLVSVVCHAPAALLPARGAEGGWLFDGYRMTGFTNEEETQAGLAEKAPWLLEDRLRESGARFDAGPAWESHVVVDRSLYTGQNPASSRAVAERVVEATKS
ncbi:type 1 glutamine amidotransferase domain-containing protein [Rhodococcus indonesiensis]|uniref:type 1 glutamine amidotransferase domain-containing protein n=1 Tax=Rhodococcus indonesiensis TaxID=3055869 RepID=UPI0039F6DD73